MRTEAAYSLRNLQDTAAIDPLIHALGDNDSDVRTAAARALAGSGKTCNRSIESGAHKGEIAHPVLVNLELLALQAWLTALIRFLSDLCLDF